MKLDEMKELNKMEEFDKIDKAVDEFAAVIKYRMKQKYVEGYRGWDEQYPIEYICKELRDDACDLVKMHASYGYPTVCKDIDVGARAMMVWYRAWYSYGC